MANDFYLSSNVNIAKDNDNRTFNGIANSGKPFFHNGKLTIVDFANLSFYDNVPVLLEHDRAKRIGFGQLAVKDNQLNIVGNLLNNELGQQIANDADGGFPFQMSAHVIPQNVVTLIGEQTAVVNGQTVKAPITILKNCRIAEVSFTPTGVDSNTSAIILSDNFNNPQEQTMQQSEIDKINEKIKQLEADITEKNKQIETLIAENEQLKAEQSKAEVDTQLSQAGFKKDEKGVWVGISQNTYDVLLSQNVEVVKTIISDLKPQKANIPDYLLSEQFTSGQTPAGENDLVAMAKQRNNKGQV